MSNTPKQRFLEDKSLSQKWLNVSDSKAFERATELSMLQLMEEAESLEWIKGAQKFVAILKGIAEPPKPLAPRPSYNLDHTMK